MKKKLFSALLFVLCLFAVGLFFNEDVTQNLTVTVNAATEGNFTYTVSNGEATITDYPESATGEVVIPDTLGGYPVTGIGDLAFYNCTGLTSIEIPDTVTSIEYSAFSGCTGLTSVKIGDSVTSIGAYSFYNCTKLTSIEIGDNVTSIGAYAFADTAYYNNTSNWNEKVLYIGNYLIAALYNISGEYKVKTGTKVIADSAFYSKYSYYTELTSIEIPDSVTNIGNFAFSCCALTTATIGKNVANIGDSAFSGCSKLTAITIPDAVTNIGSNTFAECSSLEEITFKNKETKISFYDSTIPTSTVINCLHDSTAYKYALSFNREYVLTDEHNYNLKLSLPAGCASYGFNMYECTCGAEKNEKIAPTGHTEVIDKAVAATCTNTGLTEGKHCSVCTAVLFAQKEVKALGHDWNDGEITTSATATSTGIKTYTCTRKNCGEKKTEILDKLAVTKVEAKAATNTTAGNKEYYICNGKYYLDAACTKGTNLAAVTIPVIVPTFTYGDVDKDGKITAADARLALRASVGLEKYSAGSDSFTACDVDKDGKITAADARLILRTSVGLEKLPEGGGHNHIYNTANKTVAATCTTNGYTSNVCIICKQTITLSSTKALGHSYKAATCTAPQTCTRCGAKSGTALGHSSDKGTVTKAATCTTTGTKVYKCTRCSVVIKTETINAYGHNYVSGSCSRCGVADPSAKTDMMPKLKAFLIANGIYSDGDYTYGYRIDNLILKCVYDISLDCVNIYMHDEGDSFEESFLWKFDSNSTYNTVISVVDVNSITLSGAGTVNISELNDSKDTVFILLYNYSGNSAYRSSFLSLFHTNLNLAVTFLKKIATEMGYTLADFGLTSWS